MIDMGGIVHVILAVMGLLVPSLKGTEPPARDLGAIQYRIQQDMFQEVAMDIVRSPGGYTVLNAGVTVAGHSTTLVDSSYLLDRMTIDVRAADNIRISMPFDQYVIVHASFATVGIEGHLIVKRHDEVIFDGNVNIRLLNATHKSVLRMDNSVETTFFGNYGSCVRPECKVQFSKLIVLSEELIQNTSTEMTEADFTDMFEKAVCKMYQLQFHMGFKGVKLRTSFGSDMVYVLATSSYQGIRNKTMFHTQMIDASFLNEYPRQPILHPSPIFPPEGPEAAPFEIWVHVSGFNQILKTALSSLTFPSPLHTILPLFGHLTWDAKELFILPQLRKTFPNSIVTFMMDSFDAKLIISDDKLTSRIIANCTLRDTLKCNTSRTYNVLRMSIVADIDTLVGHNNEVLNVKFTGVSGTVSIYDSIVGPIADRFLTSLVYVLPGYISEDMYNQINSKILGLRVKDFVPPGLHMEDIQLKIVQDNIVLGGRLTTGPPSPSEHYTWTGSVNDIEEQYFRLHEQIVEDAIVLPEQNCTPYALPKISSGVTQTFDVKILFLYNIILVSLVILW